MFGKIKRSVKHTIKRAAIAAVRSRKEEAYFKLAHYMAHEYPSDWSLHQIVADIKVKQKEGALK